MDFVPAGYYEGEQDEFDDEFDFGGGYNRGQFEDSSLVVSQTKQVTPDHPNQEAENEGEVCRKGFSRSDSHVGDACAPSPAKGGKGSLSSNDCSSDASESSIRNSSSINSPVTFKISNSPQESFEECDDVGPSEGIVAEPPNMLTRSRGGRSESCDLGSLRSSGQSIEREEDLKVAVTRGNVKYVARMLDGGLDPNSPLSSGWPPLLHACDSCQEAIMELLLERGADPNMSKDLLTPLMVLCMHKPLHLQDKALSCARLLISKRVKVNIRDRHHMTALLYSCQTGQSGLAELLVSAGAEVNAKDVRGWTPLLYAASKGHTSLLRLLVKAGADPKMTCNQHETPASVAYASGHVTAADWLESITSSKKGGGAGGNSDLPVHPLLSGSDSNTCSSHTSSDHTHLSTSDVPTLPSSASVGSVMGDLEMFLLGQQLGDLIPLFQEHKVEFGQLLSMTDSDLRLMGVAQVGWRKKILNGVLEVHKREWVMPENPLPYGRPISSAELTVILSNLSRHTHYLQGTTHFLLTHVQSNTDLLGPHVESTEAKKLSDRLAKTVGVVRELGREVEELRTIAVNNLPEDCVKSEAAGGHVSPSLSSFWRKSNLPYVVIGVAILSLVWHSVTR